MYCRIGIIKSSGWLYALLMVVCPFVLVAQDRAPNYNESSVPDYVLPDLLTTDAGKKITRVADWERIRRPELLRAFSSQVYGVTPTERLNVTYRVLADQEEVLGGKALRRQVEFTFAAGDKVLTAILAVYLPKKRSARVPIFVGYNFMGNETIASDSLIRKSASSALNIWPTKRERRGADQDSWPLDLIIDSGYGVATMCYSDIYPDKPEYVSQSILPLFREYEQEKSEAWQAIGAWAWGLSRIADYLESMVEVDPAKLIVLGHSRLGKAALWAGAQDQRFSMVVSNNSGCGGAALSRRKFGETVAIINQSFPHWFCLNFRRYNDREEELPVDQHALIALMAPRPVYIASAEDDLWADPKGEFLSGYFAGSVYALWGLQGLATSEMPDLDLPVSDGYIGYHIRSGKHDITSYDWQQYIYFVGKHFER